MMSEKGFTGGRNKRDQVPPPNLVGFDGGQVLQSCGNLHLDLGIVDSKKEFKGKEFLGTSKQRVSVSSEKILLCHKSKVISFHLGAL